MGISSSLRDTLTSISVIANSSTVTLSILLYRRFGSRISNTSLMIGDIGCMFGFITRLNGQVDE